METKQPTVKPLPHPPYAYEVNSDVQKVRLEAPTLNGLLLFMRCQGVGDLDVASVDEPMLPMTVES